MLMYHMPPTYVCSQIQNHVDICVYVKRCVVVSVCKNGELQRDVNDCLLFII